MNARTRLLALGVTFLVASSTVSAHTLDAPEEVMAEPDGSFRYEWSITVGPGPLFVEGFGWNGVENVFGGTVADCFCDPDFCVLEEGTVIQESAFGNLEDLPQEGLAQCWVSDCSFGDLRETTRIVPFDPTGVDPTSRPSAETLVARPNPFRSVVQLTVQLEGSTTTSLEVLDVSGRRVRDLHLGSLPAGLSLFSWDGRDAHATPVPAGIYFVRLVTDEGLDTLRKILLLR